VSEYRKAFSVLAFLAILGVGNVATAQEIRYSWFDMSFMAQDVGRAGSLSPLPGQTVEVFTTDGSGVRFRGSLAIWKNVYAMLDYGSTDIDLTGAVRNTVTGFEEEFDDEFDYTSIRGGIGLKFSILDNTDIYGELTYDSLDFDFGSFAGENFDMNRREPGATLGMRTIFGESFETRLHVRYSELGDADLTTGFFDSDVLYGIGFGWEVIRGLSIVGDYEAGEFSNWSVGFRLDLDED
jgi:hypothetical protein